jgi:hypothetical protein
MIGKSDQFFLNNQVVRITTQSLECDYEISLANEDSKMKTYLMRTAIAHTMLAAALIALPVADSMARSTPKSTQAWWPANLDLTPLRQYERSANLLVVILITPPSLRSWILMRWKQTSTAH